MVPVGVINRKRRQRTKKRKDKPRKDGWKIDKILP